ncbi:Transcriptional repressor protein [Acinetobacter baumannii]|nr:Transcriptional repressor protein [Acinetobacter baumannii]HBN8448309.1 ParB/RepB/Spo0J family partition protein [Pseudomonas aeruginosa]
MLDLSALEEKPVPAGAVAQPDGKAMRLKLTDIEPDPNQPRTEKKPEEIAEIGENIRERGVKQPISVKPHPDKPGKWIINDGELRYLGSQWAGVEDIPVVVDEDFDDFDQVNANEKRFALRPMELAAFIKRKLDDGVKKGEIARRLGKPANAITELMALVDAPACVEAVYTSGRCTSPKTLYELRALAEKFPEQVQEWCETAEDITRRTVADLGDVLKGKKKPAPAQATEQTETGGQGDGNPGGGDPEKFRHDEISGGGGSGEPTSLGGGSDNEGGGDAPKNEGGKGGKPKGDGEDGGENVDLGELTSWPRGKAVSDPDLMKKPLLLVEYEGRAAAVLLNRKPTTAGLIRIRFEDGGGDAEVDAGACKINLLTEAEK